MKRTITDEELEKMLADDLMGLDGLSYPNADAEAARFQAIGMLAIAYNKVVSRMEIVEKQKRMVHNL